MTLHIGYDHQCSKCETHYIPFDKDVPCPTCGEIEEERFEHFIPRAVESMLFNLNAGSYMPPGWYVGGLGDSVMFWLFRLFESFRLKKIDNPELDFNSFYDEATAKKPCNDERLVTYSKNMVLRINEELKKEMSKVKKDIIEEIVAEILVNAESDGQSDGIGTLTDFLLAAVNGQGEEWYRAYQNMDM